MGRTGRAGRGIRAAAALALLVVPLFPTPVAAQEYTAVAPGVQYAWWGSTDADGWHFRFPVLLLPRLEDRVTKFGATGDLTTLGQTPVELELDLSQLLRDTNTEERTGWPMDEFGRLSSFTLDPSTIRVVAYDRTTGNVRTSEGRDGLVPSTFVPSLLENAAGRNPVFNASQNAIGTLTWIVPAPFQSPRLYYVYFDTRENGPKPAVEWTEAELAPIRSLNFVRAGNELYGYLPGGSGLPRAHVYVWSLHANTTVAAYRYKYPGFPPVEIPPCGKRGVIGVCLSGGRIEPTIDPDHANLPNGLTTGSLSLQGLGNVQLVTTNEPANEPFFFKIVASKPVVAFVGPDVPAGASYQTSYWVPSADGSLLGSTFVWRAPNGPKGTNGLVVFGGDRDTPLTIQCSTCSTLFQPTLKAGDVLRFTGYSAGDLVRVNTGSPDRRVLVTTLSSHLYTGAQAVSQYGNPIGTRMLATPTNTGGMAILPHTSAGVSMFNIENPSRSFPTDGNPLQLEAGPQNAWIPPGVAFESGNAGVWQVRAHNGLVSAQYGDRGMYPVGGLDARDFQFVLRASPGSAQINPVQVLGYVMPLYPQTRVDVERWDPTRDRWATVAQKIASPDTFLTTKPGSTEPLMHSGAKPSCDKEADVKTCLETPAFYRVRSSKPILVYAYGELEGSERTAAWPYQTFLGGRTYPPVHVIGEVESYGPLVAWKEKVVQATVKPGDQVVATFEVQNLGRTAEGRALLDNIQIATRVPRGAPAWTTRLSTAFEANVPGGDARAVTVVVDVPKDAKTGEALDLSLVASSETNPAIQDTAVLQITVQTRYEIEMTFRANNRPQLQSLLEPGATRDFLVRVKNVGSGPDGVAFTMLRANPFGFEADVCIPAPDGSCESVLDAQGLARLGPDGQPIAMRLAPEEERDVVLRVTAPRTADPAQHAFVLEGTSTSDSASRRQLTLTVLTNQETALRIQLANDTFEVAPGRDAVLPVEVVNEGVETAIDMRLRAAQLPGWNLSIEPVTFELRAPGSVDPRDGRALDRRIVNLTVRAGEGAPVGFLMPIEIVAASAVRLGDAEAPEARALATAVVVNNFTLVVPELIERSVLPGATVRFEIDLRSLANGNFTLEPVATRLPPGWSLEGADPPVARLGPGEPASVVLELRTRANEAAGAYEGEFGFVQRDDDGRRAITTVPFALRVRRHVDFEAVPETDLVVPPGGATRARFTVTNTGNVEATLELSVEAPAGWSGELVDSRDALLALAPGEMRTVDLRIQAPERPVGDRAEFELRGDVPLERQIASAFNVTVLRDDLVLRSVEALTSRFRVGEPAVFQVTILNNGTVPRANVGVALVVDGRVARNVTVRSLPPGEERTVQIPWNVVPANALAVRVDPEEAYQEEDETNNDAAFDLAGARRLGAPGPGAALVGLALAVALAVASRPPRPRRGP